MIQHAEAEILAKVNELWPDVKGKVEIYKSGVRITVERMYEAPGLSFKILRALADYFGTDEINDTRFSNSGCETCDYGSSYGFTLEISAC